MKLSSLKSLNLSQWWWLFSAWWRFWGIRLRLAVAKEDWLINRNNNPNQLRLGDRGEAIETAKKLHESVRLAARCHPLKTACLPKSLVLQGMLIETGIPAQLCLGVNTDQGLSSHAWVEVDSIAIGEPESLQQDFKVITK